IVLDPSGDAYLTGVTYSVDFPVTSGVFQGYCNACTGFGNAYVTKLNPSGSALIYSTYLGSEASGGGIAIDAAGSAYVAGFTYSTTFPTTPGAFQTTCAGSPCSENPDAFITKFNATGSALIYSTYLGGALTDNGFGIAIDADGDAFVVGTTASSNFP